MNYKYYLLEVELISLPDIVINAESMNSFKRTLDRFWNDQEVKFNWKADTKWSGSNL